MLLDLKRIFGAYDAPVTHQLSLDLSEADFPGYTVPEPVSAHVTATLCGRGCAPFSHPTGLQRARGGSERSGRGAFLHAGRPAGSGRAGLYRDRAGGALRFALQRKLCRALPRLRQSKTVLLQA